MFSGMSILSAPWWLRVAKDHTTNFKLPSDIQQEGFLLLEKLSKNLGVIFFCF